MSYRGKRVFDFVAVLAAAPIWIPVLLLTAALVRLNLGTPVLFTQRRAGLNGRSFTIVKFRSMVDAVDAAGNPLGDAERLTPFGRRLRATSMDELPELLNVLRGDMSLVGPRPLFESYLPLYSEKHSRRHEVRPGVTGLSQVRGRNALSWTERLDLDVEYVERMSFALDLRILWETARVVLSGGGVASPGNATMPVFTGYEEAARRSR